MTTTVSLMYIYQLMPRFSSLGAIRSLDYQEYISMLYNVLQASAHQSSELVSRHEPSAIIIMSHHKSSAYHHSSAISTHQASSDLIRPQRSSAYQHSSALISLSALISAHQPIRTHQRSSANPHSSAIAAIQYVAGSCQHYVRHARGVSRLGSLRAR